MPALFHITLYHENNHSVKDLTDLRTYHRSYLDRSYENSIYDSSRLQQEPSQDSRTTVRLTAKTFRYFALTYILPLIWPGARIDEVSTEHVCWQNYEVTKKKNRQNERDKQIQSALFESF